MTAVTAEFLPPKIEPMPENSGRFSYLRTVIANPVAGIPRDAYERPVTAPGFARHKVVFVTDPELLEEILVRRVADFPKSEVDDRILRPAFGEGLLLAHGESWRWKRRLAAPVFSPSALADAVPRMVSPFQELVDEWRAANSTADVDMVGAMTWATLEVLDRALFSGDREMDTEAISHAIDDYLEPISWIVGYATLRFPEWVPFPGIGKFKRARNRMRAIVRDLVARRRAANTTSDDLCGRLMAARDPESDRPLSEDDLVDMLLTLIAAGHETSANGLCWAIYCLTQMPELQERLAEEAGDICGRGPLTPQAISELAYNKAFLQETMRLFPPAPLLARRTVKPETLGGMSLEKDAVVFVPVYAVHRHQAIWDEPDKFRIERFLNGADKAIPRTAYLPFGAGPRICVGATFALMEMTAGLATLLRQVRFTAVDGYVADPVQRVTLRPAGGMRICVEPR